MKRIWVTLVAAVLGLWIGYHLGLCHGQQEEQAAWRAAEQVIFNSKDGQLSAVYQSSVPTPNGPRKFAQPSKRPSHFMYFADPHLKIGVELAARRAENVPDPRNMPQR